MAANEKMKEKTPFRVLVSRFNVSMGSIQRKIFKQNSIADIEMFAECEWQYHPAPYGLMSASGRGRHQSLTVKEEELIADAVKYLINNNTPLSRQ